jgi:hypothetical protein
VTDPKQGHQDRARALLKRARELAEVRRQHEKEMPLPSNLPPITSTVAFGSTAAHLPKDLGALKPSAVSSMAPLMLSGVLEAKLNKVSKDATAEALHALFDDPIARMIGLTAVPALGSRSELRARAADALRVLAEHLADGGESPSVEATKQIWKDRQVAAIALLRIGALRDAKILYGRLTRYGKEEARLALALAVLYADVPPEGASEP